MKCTTAQCAGGQLEARDGVGNERLEMSTGRIPTLVFECVCGWKRFEPDLSTLLAEGATLRGTQCETKISSPVSAQS